jgi:hypothetical protein
MCLVVHKVVTVLDNCILKSHKTFIRDIKMNCISFDGYTLLDILDVLNSSAFVDIFYFWAYKKVGWGAFS